MCIDEYVEICPLRLSETKTYHIGLKCHERRASASGKQTLAGRTDDDETEEPAERASEEGGQHDRARSSDLSVGALLAQMERSVVCVR